MEPTIRQKRYRSAFRRRCHDLLAIGYAKLDAASFQKKEEPVISGELVLAINESIESQEAPSWAAHFIVLDDPPVNALRRSGKRRRRVDFEMIKTLRGPRPRFHFEAKRLHRSDSVSEYLGPKGIELLLNGEYAADQPDAGMLGYVQNGEPRAWAGKIGTKLRADREKYRMKDGDDFEEQQLTSALKDTYLSKHDRPAVGKPIAIFHTFLWFG